MTLHSIPYTASQVTVSHGFLNSPDLLGWALSGLMVLAGLFIGLPQLRQSAKALWVPVGAFLSRLCCPWAWEGLFMWSALSGAFLRPLKTFWDDFPEDEDGQYREQLRRKAFWGFIPPILT